MKLQQKDKQMIKALGTPIKLLQTTQCGQRWHMNSGKEQGLANYYGKIKSWWREIVLKNVWNKLRSMHNVNVW